MLNDDFTTNMALVAVYNVTDKVAATDQLTRAQAEAFWTDIKQRAEERLAKDQLDLYPMEK